LEKNQYEICSKGSRRVSAGVLRLSNQGVFGKHAARYTPENGYFNCSFKGLKKKIDFASRCRAPLKFVKGTLMACAVEVEAFGLALADPTRYGAIRPNIRTWEQIRGLSSPWQFLSVGGRWIRPRSAWLPDTVPAVPVSDRKIPDRVGKIPCS